MYIFLYNKCNYLLVYLIVDIANEMKAMQHSFLLI